MVSPSLAPTRYAVLLENGQVLLSNALGVLQGDVVDLAADALHGVLGRSGDVGAALLAQVLQAVLGTGTQVQESAAVADACQAFLLFIPKSATKVQKSDTAGSTASSCHHFLCALKVPCEVDCAMR